MLLLRSLVNVDVNIVLVKLASFGRVFCLAVNF